MSDPYLSEIRIMGFNFAPRGWAHCDGQYLPINQNQSLFSLMGTYYGGDGRTTFGLPDLRGRTPLHIGDRHRLGEKRGAETVTLTAAEMPAHTHAAKASSSDADAVTPAGGSYARAQENIYAVSTSANASAMAPQSISGSGGGQTQNNMQPYQALNFCIAMSGMFPSRN